MYVKKFLGWETATKHEYALCYDKFGGNFSTHPDTLAWLHAHADCEEEYFIHFNRDKQPDGAVCVWSGNTVANDISTQKITEHLALPIARDELILPFSADLRAFLPFKAKNLSELNCHNILNASKRINAGRQVSIAKHTNESSAKTSGNRKRELKKFLAHGGEIRDQSEFSASELVHLYADLFRKRRGSDITNLEGNIAFVAAMRDHFFGKIIFFNGEPCAYQLIVKAESKSLITFDYINIGMDPNFKAYSAGTILMWLNINAAQELCQAHQKKIRYSFGRPTAEYKNMWCNEFPIGRVLTF